MLSTPNELTLDRYAYGVGLPHSFLGGHILKIGIDHGSMVAVWEDPDCLATEPQFVPEPLQPLSSYGSGGTVFDSLHSTQYLSGLRYP